MGLAYIPERFLRYIWQRQEFLPSYLHTSDGKKVSILSPGVPNTDGGPDYVNARIRIGGITYTGDVELHTRASHWSAHGHQHDPHYNGVILHVVVTTDRGTPPTQTLSHRVVPLLVLHTYRNETPQGALMNTWLDEHVDRIHHLSCSAFNDDVPAHVMFAWLQKLATNRCEIKIRRFEERLKQLSDERKRTVCEMYARYNGHPDEIPLPKKDYTKRDLSPRALWEQLLYEGVMEAMGYSKNRVPFLALAQEIMLEDLRRYSLAEPQTVMAILFGAAGLLPSTRSIREKESRSYVRVLRKKWKELRPEFKRQMLHEGDWLFFRLRPHNFPTTRLAVVCLLLPSLFDDGGLQKIIEIFRDDALPTPRRIELLMSLFKFVPDEFWHCHYHFRGERGISGASLGEARVREILINVVVPFVLLYARIFTNATVRANAHRVFMALPATPDNSIIRKMRKELLKEKGTLKTAAVQQGVIQLYKTYCFSARCGECAIGRHISSSTSSKQEVQPHG